MEILLSVVSYFKKKRSNEDNLIKIEKDIGEYEADLTILHRNYELQGTAVWHLANPAILIYFLIVPIFYYWYMASIWSFCYFFLFLPFLGIPVMLFSLNEIFQMILIFRIDIKTKMLENLKKERDKIRNTHTKATTAQEKFKAETDHLIEKTILYTIVDEKSNGFICLNHEVFSILGEKKKDKLNWLSRHKDVFRIQKETVYPCVEEIKPCVKYWMGKCSISTCQMFHICKLYLFGITHNSRKCSLSHDLNDTHNRRIKFDLAFKFSTDDDLTFLLNTRFPKVCLDYQTGACMAGENDCTNLHICYNHMKDDCKTNESLCGLKHDSALYSVQAQRLMTDFHLTKTEFKDCIIIPSAHFKPKTMEIDKDKFDSWKDYAICCYYLVGECDDDSLLHPKGKLPYLWQYRKCDIYDSFGPWVAFDQQMNINIEKQFCDPAKENWDSIKHLNVTYIGLNDLQTPGIHFFELNGETINVVIRRLSTKSSVMENKKHPALTEWIWYWNNGNGWTEYTFATKSFEIEKAFQQNSEKPYYFKTNEYQYGIYFDEMMQKNLGPRFFTMRKIKRRPVFKTRSQVLPSLIPSHWPKTFVAGEKIQLEADAYQKMKSDFELSIGVKVIVMDIKEICNEDQYKNYQRKKQKFIQQSKEANEMLLYHGTDSTVVESICAQNFEWRLCGKNATMYGQGSYFAKSASYSHNYTIKDNCNVRYMFLADVLTGKPTKGSSADKLPPLLPGSKLERYDSCVDNTQHPNMYIIFYKEQCYPRYLITYKEYKDATVFEILNKIVNI